jgi:hypothetical protein
MKSEYLKYFTALITILVAFITFYISSEKSGLFFLTEKNTVILVGFAAAYVAFFSLFISRRLERHRMNKRIFIIYSHKDIELARTLTEQLKAKGYNPWLDEQEIVPGQNWAKAINQAIEKSSIALFLSSKNIENSQGFAMKEIKVARELLRANQESHSPIIPVYLEESKLPEELAGIHAVKLYEKNGFEQLEKGLEYVLGNRT